MLCLHRGFDGLDVSFAGRIQNDLCQALEGAKGKAQSTRQSAYISWGGINLEVAETGARGGYLFRCATGGELGIIWFFKRPTRGDPWGIRASCRSFGLASKGLGGMRTELYTVMERLGVVPSAEGESIGRVDYAIDILAPGLRLNPDHFVMHSNANRVDHFEDFSVNGRSGRVTSVTVGKMPGRQLIVYDKRAEAIATGKQAWWTIWNSTLERLNLPLLEPTDPTSSKVWRIELRAGKKHLKDDWGIRRWTDLDRHLADVAMSLINAIRHVVPNGDSNRSRWPDSKLWHVVRRQVAEDLMEMTCSVPPDLIKKVQLEAHDQMLAAQMAGLLTSRAALHKLPARDLSTFALTVGEELSKRVAEAPEHFGRKLDTAMARYDVLGG